MSKFYISHGTLIKLNSVDAGAPMRVLLETLASCAEFSSIRFRAGEKTVSLFPAAQLLWEGRSHIGFTDFYEIQRASPLPMQEGLHQCGQGTSLFSPILALITR